MVHFARRAGKAFKELKNREEDREGELFIGGVFGFR